MLRRSSRGQAALAVLIVVLPSSLFAEAAPSEDFPRTVEVAEKRLQLNGEALCEWGIFAIDLYRAALYLETRSRDGASISRSRERKQLRMVFSRSLSREQLNEAWTASFEVNAGKRFSSYKKELKLFVSWLVDVDEGDTMVFTYVPKRGLQVKINDREKGWVDKDSFGLMFFQLYVGEHPPTKAVRRGLLGR